jgi:hypothetical protein
MAIILDGSTGISSIGTLTGVTSISSASANTPVILGDSGTNYNTCRAWVNFNGTSTVAIRASFNVSSITDNGTGNYTINFTNALPNANYAVAGSGSSGGRILSVGTLTTTNTQVLVYNAGDVAEDVATVSVSIFR